MSAQKLKIGKQSFVLLPEREFALMQRENKQYQRWLDQERKEIAEAQRRMKDPRRKTIPLSQLKLELGL